MAEQSGAHDPYVEALVNVGVDRAEAKRRVADQRARGLLSEPSVPSRLRDLATTDPMVPPGYIEVRDSDGKLLSRHRIGDTNG